MVPRESALHTTNQQIKFRISRLKYNIQVIIKAMLQSTSRSTPTSLLADNENHRKINVHINSEAPGTLRSWYSSNNITTASGER